MSGRGRTPPRSFYARDSLELAPALLNKLLVHGTGDERVVVRIVEVEAYRGSDDPGSHAYRGMTKRNATMFGAPGHLYVYFTYGMHWCMNVVCGAASAREAGIPPSSERDRKGGAASAREAGIPPSSERDRKGGAASAREAGIPPSSERDRKGGAASAREAGIPPSSERDRRAGEEHHASAVLLRAAAPVRGVELMRERRGGLSDRALCSGPARLTQALGVTGELDGADLVRGPVRIHDDGTPPPVRPGVSCRIGLREGRGDDRPWRFFVEGDPNLSRREPAR